MSLVHIRITPDLVTDLQLFKNVIDYYSNPTQPMLLVVHEGDNVKKHYHSVFTINVKKIDTVREGIKKHFKGNKSYQVKKCDKQMFQYILHSGSEVIRKSIFTDDDINDLKIKSKEYHDMLIQLSKKNKTKNNFCLKKELKNYFNGKRNLTQYEIGKKMIELCIQNEHLVPSIYYGKQLVFDIYTNSNFRDNESEIVNMYVTDMTRF